MNEINETESKTSVVTWHQSSSKELAGEVYLEPHNMFVYFRIATGFFFLIIFCLWPNVSDVSSCITIKNIEPYMALTSEETHLR